MKATLLYPTQKPLPYPNAATRRQLWNKFLDLLIMAASGMGIAASLLLLLSL